MKYTFMKDQLQFSNLKLRFRRLYTNNLLLFLLLAGDVAFILIHTVYYFTTDLNKNPLYSLYTDRGYSEIFQYLKTYWIIIILSALWWRTRQFFYVSWILLFTYILSDDALQIHEKVGVYMAETYGFTSALGLRAQDFGQLTASALFGIPIILFIFISYIKSSKKNKAISQDLALLFIMLVFCGVFIDMLHILIENRYLRGIAGIVEDGGEMIVMSFTCGYVFNVFYQFRST